MAGYGSTPAPENICIACSPNCKNCSKSGGFCEICNENFELVNRLCQMMTTTVPPTTTPKPTIPPAAVTTQPTPAVAATTKPNGGQPTGPPGGVTTPPNNVGNSGGPIGNSGGPGGVTAGGPATGDGSGNTVDNGNGGNTGDGFGTGNGGGSDMTGDNGNGGSTSAGNGNTSPGNGGNGDNGNGGNSNLVAAILGSIFGILALLMIGLLMYCCLPRCYTPIALIGVRAVPAPEPVVARVVPRRRWYYRWTYGRSGGGYGNEGYQEYDG